MHAVAAATIAVCVAVPPVATAQSDSDSRGYLDSTARCDGPQTAAAFGRTASARIAVCRLPDGGLQYRGVRLRDGAKLIVAAEQSGEEFVAANDGVTYSVSAKALVVRIGSRVVRDEPMLEYRRPDLPVAETPTRTTTSAPTPTSTTPLPPPLAAEVGGG
jgi:hypothetical protein